MYHEDSEDTFSFFGKQNIFACMFFVYIKAQSSLNLWNQWQKSYEEKVDTVRSYNRTYMVSVAW